MEQIAEIWDEEAFTVSARLTDSDGARIIDVLYDELSTEQSVGNFAYQSSQPIARVKASDVKNTKKGDSLQISSIIYYILEVNPDGTGEAQLVLSLDIPT